VADLLEYLKPAGEVILFGGVLRDLALEGGRVYPSDIDIVVRTSDKERLGTLIKPHRARTNRFGGYRFSLGRWNFDVWSFSDTWAFRAGLVPGDSIDDLLRTTFFDWDAIAYVANSRRFLFGECYFEKIERRVVDINLVANPNPFGAAIRALRIYESGRGQLTPRLAKYTIDTVRGRSVAGSGGLHSGTEVSAWARVAAEQLATRFYEDQDSPVGGDARQVRMPA
jgi:hypothetical protein